MSLSPEREKEIRGIYDEDCNHKEEMQELLAEIDELREKLKLAVDALEWYSDGVYPGDESETEPGILRSGKRARVALAKIIGGEKK